jgi:hypothetical protein
MRPQRPGVKWRLSVACTALVVGGFAAGGAALHDRTPVAESAAVHAVAATAPPASAPPPTSTPAPVAVRPSLPIQQPLTLRENRT